MKKVLFTILTSAIVLTSCNAKASTETGAKPEDAKVEETTKEKQHMGTIQMTKTDFLTKIHNYEKDMQKWAYLGDKPAVIDFYADWCGPCKQIAPILEELANEYADDIYIYKVNVDEQEELAALFNVRSIPTLLFIPMDGQPQLAAGGAPRADLKNAIDGLLLKKEDK